ncbi:MAG: hypothetical protein KC589_10330 [Nanoarchaeota archaeon]|nr:hypothetical protein [Nanoarchaeota archaeon]
MYTTSTGLKLYTIVEENGWQFALKLLELQKHPSQIWNWQPSQQSFEYTMAKVRMNNGK